MELNRQSDRTEEASAAGSDASSGAWLRAGYIFIAFFLLSRLAYLAAGRIELSEDEAYQWLWSKHLDISYYSKPPLIAWLQWLGTHLWGDNEFGIRFFSPVLGAALSLAMLRFVAAEVNARAAFWLIVILAVTPMLAVGSTLLTIDAPSVCFWVLAMITGWRAIQRDSLALWCWTGCFVGLGLLSKYTALVQILSWPLFFWFWPPARAQSRRAGPYVALLIALLAFAPVVVWNAQHDWVTLLHLKDRGGLNEAWRFRPRFFSEFILSEFGLLNPVFFTATIWACVAFWTRRERKPLQLYFFFMGAPLALFYLGYTIRARVQPNWIAPSVVPLFALAVVYWDERWRNGLRAVRGWLIAGVSLGFVAVAILHGTEIVGIVTGHPIPAKADPLHRVRGWSRIAGMFGAERNRLLAEGKPVFFLTQHYGLTSILSFYLPEAKAAVNTDPLVYHIRMTRPLNQFYFWRGYASRVGQNAIYIEETDTPSPAPATLIKEFESVENLGMREAFYNGEVYRRYQLYFCRGLKPK